MCVTLQIIQEMVKQSDLVGPALVPFYRQLLPMFNAYKLYEGKLYVLRTTLNGQNKKATTTKL